MSAIRETGRRAFLDALSAQRRGGVPGGCSPALEALDAALSACRELAREQVILEIAALAETPGAGPYPSGHVLRRLVRRLRAEGRHCCACNGCDPAAACTCDTARGDT